MTERPRPLGVGMPAWIMLNEYGRMLHQAFGCYPLLVGSALARKDPRDIDVRIVLDDDRYQRLVGKLDECDRAGTRWAMLCAAFSALGRQVTGLPIDFQLKTAASAAPEAGYPRLPFGVSPAQHQVYDPMEGAHVAE
jgi:hypothetical protein